MISLSVDHLMISGEYLNMISGEYLNMISGEYLNMISGDTFNNIGGHFYWWRQAEYPEKITELLSH
jgi:hypothetical protein